MGDISLAVLTSEIVEGTETVVVNLTGFGAHDPQITLGATTSATVNITDDDAATGSIAKINEGPETNTPTNGLFRVTQTAVSSTDTVVNYTVDVASTATAGSDYTTLSGTVTILAGQTTAYFFFKDPTTTKIYALSLHEALPIGFGAHDPQITLGATTSATVNITDDDAAT